jgi:hypothetical protein
MRLGRGLLTGMGWAGTIGGIALCVLMFLFTYVVFEGPRKDDRVATLPSVHEGPAPAVQLARPEGRVATGRATPRRGAAKPRAAAPLPPGRGAPSPTSAPPTPSGAGGGGDGLSR